MPKRQATCSEQIHRSPSCKWNPYHFCNGNSDIISSLPAARPGPFICSGLLVPLSAKEPLVDIRCRYCCAESCENPLPAARILIENKLFTVGLAWSKTPQLLRRILLATLFSSDSKFIQNRAVGFLKNPAMNDRKAPSTTSSRSAGCELDLHGPKDSSCCNKNASMCSLLLP